MNKKSFRIQGIQEMESILRCPICQQPMNVMESKSVICKRKHTFDITKQGYVNFMEQPMKSSYTKSLFAARHEVFNLGFYDPLILKLAELIKEHKSSTLLQGKLMMLDSGCGEGSHLAQICHDIQQFYGDAGSFLHGIGIDISKEAILAASKYHEVGNWFVADLAKSPFVDQSFDIILNVLSPSNYDEFHRLLKKEGIVMKVVPGQDYLRELRIALFGNRTKHVYSNQKTVDYFYTQFHTVKRAVIRYTHEVQAPQLPYLVQMTPLSWSSSEDTIQHVLSLESLEVTIDFEILIGSHRKEDSNEGP